MASSLGPPPPARYAGVSSFRKGVHDHVCIQKHSHARYTAGAYASEYTEGARSRGFTTGDSR